MVIGGGISGLVCAYALREAGVPVVLLEQTLRVGGVVDTVEQEGFLFELGPQSCLTTNRLLELIAALGLGSELRRADPRAPRFMLQGGHLVRVPMSPPGLLFSSLLDTRTKWRLLTEPLRRTQPPAEDESVADFVRRKFGADLLERLAGPFVSGIYAGDPEKLSLRSAFPVVHQWEKEYGSILRGAIKSRAAKGEPRHTLCTFAGGMATLTRALGQELGDSLRCGAGVTSVRRASVNGKSAFDLQVDNRGRRELLTAGAVVVATDTQSAGKILAGIAPEFSAQFARIEYAPVAVVSMGFRRGQIGHPLKGFGFLVPREEGLRSLGTVWNSSLFPNRAPEGTVNLTSFAGGATDPALLNLHESEILRMVARELAGVLQITGEPLVARVHRVPRALPQYNLGHDARLAPLRHLAASVPGLFLAGNYLDGPSIGACVERALRVADQARQYLASRDEISAAHAAGVQTAPGTP